MTAGAVPPHPLDLAVSDLGAGYRTGAFAPTEVVAESLRRVEGAGERHGAVTEVVDGALEDARVLTAELGAGQDRGPLHGVPIVVKELVDLAGRRRTAGTHVRPPGWTRPATQDAAVIARLREAGAVVVARGRTHEFAWGITSRHPDGSGVTNPLDPTLVAGGSSGGVAALLAAGCAPVGIGTDTGGSVRIPATFCGLVGWKPAIGRLPVRGVVPLAPTFDHVGVLARTVGDVLAVDAVLGGGLAPGPGPDSPPPRAWSLEDASLPPVAVAIQEDVRAAAARAGARAPIVAGPAPGRLPPAEASVDVYAVVQRAEALAVHRDLLGTWPQQADAYGHDVAGRLREAERLEPAAVVRARLARREVQAGWHRAFTDAGADALILPAASCGPPTVREPDRVLVDGAERPLREAVLPFTVPANVTGWPALVVPVGSGVDGRPAAVQVVTRPGGEHHLAALAARLGP